MIIEKIHSLFKKYPIVSSLVLIIVFFAFSKAYKLLIEMFLKDDMYDLVVNIIGILFPLLLVILCGYKYIFTIGDFFKTLRVGLFWVIMQSLVLVLEIWTSFFVLKDVNIKSTFGLIIGFIEIFGIGFREEVIFRGIIGNSIGRKYGKDKSGVWLACIVSGFLFGSFHMTNYFAGVNMTSTLIQSLVACGAGVMLTAIYYRGGSIWGLIFIHSLIDAVSLFPALFTNDMDSIEAINRLSLKNITPFFLCMLISLFLLRNKKITEAINFLNADCDNQ